MQTPYFTLLKETNGCRCKESGSLQSAQSIAFTGTLFILGKYSNALSGAEHSNLISQLFSNILLGFALMESLILLKLCFNSRLHVNSFVIGNITKIRLERALRCICFHFGKQEAKLFESNAQHLLIYTKCG